MQSIGYALEMGLRPQTLYGLADSPVALAAWMLDHDARSLEDIARAFEGSPADNLTRDEILDNITMTWLTNTGISCWARHTDQPRPARRDRRHDQRQLRVLVPDGDGRTHPSLARHPDTQPTC
jgi:hypothetical protein